MGPKRDATEEIRIPEWNWMILMDFIIKELLHPHIESDEVIAEKIMPPQDDVFKENKTKTPQERAEHDIFSIQIFHEMGKASSRPRKESNKKIWKLSLNFVKFDRICKL